MQEYRRRWQRFPAGLGADQIQECLVGREHERAGTQSLVAAGYIAGSAREFADVLRVVTVGDGPGRHAVVAALALPVQLQRDPADRLPMGDREVSAEGEGNQSGRQDE